MLTKEKRQKIKAAADSFAINHPEEHAEMALRVQQFTIDQAERKLSNGSFQHFNDDAKLQQHLRYVKESVDAGLIAF